jgi:para-nitrobenzyl esterase
LAAEKTQLKADFHIAFYQCSDPSLSASISPDGKAKEWPLYDLKDRNVMVLDEFDIHPARESEIRMVDWNRSYCLARYYML